ncbi:MAG TPA: hypothetical protein VGC30_11150 [Dokdonella sp.]
MNRHEEERAVRKRREQAVQIIVDQERRRLRAATDVRLLGLHARRERAAQRAAERVTEKPAEG